MNNRAAHCIRIYKELREAGVTDLAAKTSEGRYLVNVIHPDETIGGVIYGTCEGSFAMLIATDMRMIYLDRKPIFTRVDELTYDIVSGVELNDLKIYAGVRLHTRYKDYGFRWVSRRCAYKFAAYVEKKRLENSSFYRQTNRPAYPASPMF